MQCALPLLLALLSPSTLATAQEPVPRTPALLQSYGSSSVHALALEGDSAYVVTASSSFASGSTPVEVHVSADGGASFGPAVDVHGGLAVGGISDVDLLAEGDDVFVFWTSRGTSSSPQATYCVRSGDRGTTFEAPVLVDSVGVQAGQLGPLAIALDAGSGGTQIVLAQSLGDALFATSSFDGGRTWGPAAFVDGGGSPTRDVLPSYGVTLQGNDVHLAYAATASASTRVYVASSVDGGRTFPGPSLRIEPNGAWTVPSIQLRRDGDRLVVAWIALNFVGGKRRMLAAISSDGGTSWSDSTLVGNTVPGVGTVTSIDVELEGARILAAFSESRDSLGYRQLFVARSEDFGSSFTEVEIEGFEGGWLPDLAGRGENWVLGYEAGFSLQSGAAAVSVDGGQTWTSEISLTQAENPGSQPTLVAYDPLRENVVTAQRRGADLTTSGFSLCDDGRADVRTSGTNPNSLSAGVPLLGSTWTATVDLASTGHPLACLSAYPSPLDLTLPGGQTLLVNVFDPAGEQLQLAFAAGDPATFTLAVPNAPSLCGVALSVQAVHFGGAGPFQLSNAVDLVSAGL